MSRDGAIEIEGTVVEALPAKGKSLYRVALVNGHKLLAYPRGRKVALPQLGPGDKIMLEMSPFDFSKGRILKKQETVL